MKRKVMILLIAGIMVIGSLSGCVSASNDEAETSAQTEEEAEANEYYEAGRAYLYGLDGKEINLESARTNFERAVELGKTEANFYLGVLYDWYIYPEQDFEMARAYYEECGDDPYAQLALGLLYYYGDGVEEDKERARELFQSVIEQGYVEGYFGTGCFLHDEGEYEAAMEDYIKASEGTEPIFTRTAMNNIGWAYCHGDGVEQDYALAMEWYEKAAALGDINAMLNIGTMYSEGNGVEQDYTLAMEWYEKAADIGDATAMNNIGTMYYNGDGVKQDYALAIEWYEKAADLGNISAMNNIGAMYFYGDVVEQDYEKALEWFEKAADLGSEAAKTNAEYIRQLIQ